MTVGAYALAASGPVTVLEAGTVTKATTFTDITGGTPGPNPVPPQPNGIVQIFADVGDVDLLVPGPWSVSRMTVAIA